MLCFGAWRAAPLAILEEPQAVWVSSCWNGKSTVGWLLTAAGALFIFAGILANMHVYFRPTSLFNTLVMLILLVGGLALIARSIRPHPVGENH